MHFITWKQGKLHPYMLALCWERICHTNGPRLRTHNTRIQNNLYSTLQWK